MELIRAMPPAAAAPPSRRVGKVQNSAGETIRPAAATHSAINATSGEDVRAETASARPAMPALRAPMAREFPRASHQGGTMVTATRALIHGKDVTNPTFNPTGTPGTTRNYNVVLSVLDALGGYADTSASPTAVTATVPDVLVPVATIPYFERFEGAVGPNLTGARGFNGWQVRPIAGAARVRTADPRTLTAWGQEVGVSRGALRVWCAAAGVSARASLDFLRILRAVVLSPAEGWDLRSSLDVVDQRSFLNLLKRGGVREVCVERTPIVEEFLRIQRFLDAPQVLQAVTRRLNEGRG